MGRTMTIHTKLLQTILHVMFHVHVDYERMVSHSFVVLVKGDESFAQSIWIIARTS